MTIVGGLGFLEVAASQAQELDEAVFSGYIDGLRDAGWRGDERLARLGCTVNSTILNGLLWNLFFLETLQKSEGLPFWRTSSIAPSRPSSSNTPRCCPSSWAWATRRWR